jgi:hypothetical protein
MRRWLKWAEEGAMYKVTYISTLVEIDNFLKKMPKALSSIPTKDDLSKFKIDSKNMKNLLGKLYEHLKPYKIEFDEVTKERAKVWYNRQWDIDFKWDIKFRLEEFRNKEFETLLKQKLKQVEKHYEEALVSYEMFKKKVIEDSSQNRVISKIHDINEMIYKWKEYNTKLKTVTIKDILHTYRKNLIEIHRIKMKYIESTEEIVTSNLIKAKEDTEQIDAYLLDKESEFVVNYNNEIKEYNTKYNRVMKNQGKLENLII